MARTVLLISVNFLGFCMTFWAAAFFLLATTVGHAFPVLGFATAAIVGCAWGLVGGVVFGAKKACRTAVFGSGAGVLAFAVSLASDRRETLGYLAGFFSEWRASLAAMLWLVMLVLIFASISAGLKRLFTHHAKSQNQ